MKNRSFRLTAMSAMALTAVLLGSCSADDTQEVSNPSQQAVVSQNALTFKFSLPQGNPVTYTIPDEAEEWAVKKLTILEFDSAGNYVNRVTIDDVASSSEVTNNYDGTYVYTKALGASTASKRIYAFVANFSVPSVNNLTDYMNLSLFTMNGQSRDLLLNDGGVHYFPMSGFAYEPGAQDYTVRNEDGITAEVKLKRTMARVDVESTDNNLVITSVKILRGNQLARVAEKPLGSVSVIPTAAALQNTDVTSTGYAHIPVGGMSVVKQAAYLYEDPKGTVTDDNKTVVVQITGLYNGNQVVYNVPFKNGAQRVEVKRNYLYSVVLGDGGSTLPGAGKIKYKIVVKDWQDGGVDNVKVTTLKINYTGTAGTYDLANSKLTVAKTATQNTFALSSTVWQVGGVTYSAQVDPTAASWLQATVSGTTLNVNTTQTNSGTSFREGWVKVIATKGTATVERFIVVRQNN